MNGVGIITMQIITKLLREIIRVARMKAGIEFFVGVTLMMMHPIAE
jgi:hypothetical protein